MNKLNDIDFYLLTDSTLSKNGIFSDVKDALKAGCKIIQYREKKKSTKAMINEAEKIKKMCKNNALFLVNDRADVSFASNARIPTNNTITTKTNKIIDFFIFSFHPPFIRMIFFFFYCYMFS